MILAKHIKPKCLVTNMGIKKIKIRVTNAINHLASEYENKITKLYLIQKIYDWLYKNLKIKVYTYVK